MTKQEKQPLEVIIHPEISSMILYENEKNRAEYLEEALAQERKRVVELEKMLKESQIANEVTTRSYYNQQEKYDKMSSLVGKALSTRKNK